MEQQKRNQLFGQRLKALRTERNISQAELAERVGKADDTISKLETGTTSTRLATVFDLADALNVSFLDFFDWVTPRKLSSEEIQTERLVQSFRAMLRGESEITADELKRIMAALARQKNRPR